jgi:hypothetical protein
MEKIESGKGRPLKVFDWNMAAMLIKERGALNASAGLEGDWGCTSDTIFGNGIPDMGSWAYLASTWAIPSIKINEEIIPCYMEEKDAPLEWIEDGKSFANCRWPKSALELLK